MKTTILSMLLLLGFIGLAGCEREISSQRTVRETPGGDVRVTEKKTVEKPDGSVETRTEKKTVDR